MRTSEQKKKWNKYISDYNKKPQNRAKANKRNREAYKKNPEKYKAYVKKSLAKTPEKLVNHRLQVRYGISLEEYTVMLETQKGVCKICAGTNENGWRLAVDHDHKTGKVRGLLCNGCNRKLGWYEILENNIKEYLKG